jgi:predicted nuclease with TOPRIM domain
VKKFDFSTKKEKVVMGLEKFDILEEKINQLAEKYNQIKLEKDNFLSHLQKKENEILALQDKVNSLEGEKEVFKTRLDKIISHLESTAGNL